MRFEYIYDGETTLKDYIISMFGDVMDSREVERKNEQIIVDFTCGKIYFENSENFYEFAILKKGDKYLINIYE